MHISKEDQFLARTNIFILLGLENLEQKRKDELSIRMRRVVLLDFFLNDVEHHLSEQELERIEHIFDHSDDHEQVLQELTTHIPDLPQKLVYKTLLMKKAVFSQQVAQQLHKVKKKKEIYHRRAKQKTSEVQGLLDREHTILERLNKLIQSNAWDRVEDIFYAYRKLNPARTKHKVKEAI